MSAPAVLTPHKIAGFGWRPDRPDFRDKALTPKEAGGLARVRKTSDMRQEMPAIYNQSSLGSCTANAIGAALEFTQMKEGLAALMPSRLFIYYCERFMENTVGSDAGAEIRDGMKVVHKLGAPPEDIWPYDIQKFTIQPPAEVYAAAVKHEATKYLRCAQSFAAIRKALSSDLPVVFGISVYESFESENVAAHGVVPMPAASEKLLGGHAIVIVGHNDGPKDFNGCPPKHYIVRNSWGPEWGDQGYFYLPYEYVHNPQLASDFWTIRLAS